MILAFTYSDFTWNCGGGMGYNVVEKSVLISVLYGRAVLYIMAAATTIAISVLVKSEFKSTASDVFINFINTSGTSFESLPSSHLAYLPPLCQATHRSPSPSYCLP